MTVIEWSDDYNINVRELDDQHKMLVGLMNQLIEAIKTNEKEENIHRILDNLITDTAEHFLREETLMLEFSDPGYEEHRNAHNKLSTEVVKYFKDYHEGDIDTVQKLVPLLKDWLMDHLIKEDKKLGEFLNSKGIT